jgi:hypothetical protein
MGSQPGRLRDFSAISHSAFHPPNIIRRGQMDKTDSRGTHKRKDVREVELNILSQIGPNVVSAGKFILKQKRQTQLLSPS